MLAGGPPHGHGMNACMHDSTMHVQDTFNTGSYPLQIKAEIGKLEALFDGGHVVGWAATDILCQRVVAKLVTRSNNPGTRMHVYRTQCKASSVPRPAGSLTSYYTRPYRLLEPFQPPSRHRYIGPPRTFNLCILNIVCACGWGDVAAKNKVH